MKYTLLQMTQDILSNLSSDEINSISDTAESLQVATIIRQKYYDIINRLDLTNHEQLLQLAPSLVVTSPVLMKIPDGVSDIRWIKYYDSNVLDGNTSTNFAHDLNLDLKPTVNPPTAPPGYLDVTILPNDDFIQYVQGFSTSDTNTKTFQFSDTSNGFPGNFTFNYKIDQQPIYCTVLSNYYVIFDGYDQSQDDTLQASKTMVYATIIPTFQMVDSFIPDLEEEQFPLLLSEAKELAYFELKQSAHPLASREGQRHWSTIQKKKAIINRPTFFDELPGFGRQRGFYGYRGTFNNSYFNKTGGLY